jgi:predicted PurR-regulated permease PerM
MADRDQETDAEEAPQEPKVEEVRPVVIETPVDIRSLTITVIAVIGTILMLQYARPVLIPIVIGVLISYVLAPAVTSLAKRGIHRAVGAFLILGLISAAIGWGVYTLSDDVVDIIDDMPVAAERLRQRFNGPTRTAPSERGLLERVQEAAEKIDKTAAEASEPVPVSQGVQRVEVVEPPFRATDYLWSGGRGVVSFLGQAAVVLFLVYFLLVTDDLFKRKIVRIAGPTLSKRRISVQIMDDINRQISGFLRVQVITSAIVAGATGVALWWFGVDNYIIWALLAGVFNSIPYLGPIVVSGGLAIVTFMQFDDLVTTIYVSGTALLITSLEGWLLTPVLMSRAAQMNPVAIFVGLLFFSWVWGVWGTILAVPMLMAIKAVCDRVEDFQPVGEMLGE